MSERDVLVTALYSELVGPRGGIREVLEKKRDPRNEYILGVLAPREAPDLKDIDDESELIMEAATGEEDQDGNDQLILMEGAVSPALNPKSPPRSIGVSFVVEGASSIPVIEICATWARYSETDTGWVREPFIFITDPVQISDRIQWSAGPGVLLELRGRRLYPDRNIWKVSLFIVNVTELAERNRPATADYVFQPQIRVHLGEGTSLLPLSVPPCQGTGDGCDADLDSIRQEDESLDLLYMNRRGMARGHLTGAYWKEIDPERPHPTLPSPDREPFYWTDGSELSLRIRKKFSPADVRTDFLPCYPVEAPEMSWSSEYGPPPQLDPEVLAECWDPAGLTEALSPLPAGYRSWLEKLRQQLQLLPPGYLNVANRHLKRVETTVERIEEAIRILATDNDVRLSFCFANRAMALQARWGGRILRWRPFQLAFILLNIPSISEPEHPDRNTCDLLWFPTGGGKTEAYLGLTALVLALRRRRAPCDRNGHRTATGTGVLSRYTLRLLTIQQFRRALGVITACEYLRVTGLGRQGARIGWRPGSCCLNEDFIWGTERFSTGLWVGGSVTPNNMQTITFQDQDGRIRKIWGALDILTQNPRDAEGEPAQVLRCPCCSNWLAVPTDGLEPGNHTLHLVFKGSNVAKPTVAALGFRDLILNTVSVTTHANRAYHTISLQFTVPSGSVLTVSQVDEWWSNVIAPALGNVRLQSARASRPGYFIREYVSYQRTFKGYDFDIVCSSPECGLNAVEWAEKVPVAVDSQVVSSSSDGEWQEVIPAFQVPGRPRNSSRIPIPAYTVDDQVYHRCPSLLVATVDKFARLAFEPRAASIFGNVEYFHSRWGYYRRGCPPSWGQLPVAPQEHPPGGGRRNPLYRRVQRFLTPDLIIQDELHLIEGPLGSMVGLYETAIEQLCRRPGRNGTIVSKYVASTATVRQAEPQVQAIFDRTLNQFPAPGLTIDDSFFARTRESHHLDCQAPGRLYIGVCPPGKGAQTPILRIWASLLQTSADLMRSGAGPAGVDPFWTLVGYFNAIRELAGALSLYRQDIPERMQFMAGLHMRPLTEKPMELSSRCDSLELPGMLERLGRSLPSVGVQDAVLATSMFGTGVDVDRLGLMVVHGQPKTTASYIQATGRVGRRHGGLVVTFLRAGRPRDLDHYEYFTGYHRSLYRNVEPVAVAPFSPRARERLLGPLAVVLLRQADFIDGTSVDDRWRIQQRISGAGYECWASLMSLGRRNPEVIVIPSIFERRAMNQPLGRKPVPGTTLNEMDSEIDRWASLAGITGNRLVYHEAAVNRPPERPVVLGDPQHQLQNIPVAYENTPESLRDVEATTRFKTEF